MNFFNSGEYLANWLESAIISNANWSQILLLITDNEKAFAKTAFNHLKEAHPHLQRQNCVSHTTELIAGALKIPKFKI